MNKPKPKKKKRCPFCKLPQLDHVAFVLTRDSFRCKLKTEVNVANVRFIVGSGS